MTRELTAAIRIRRSSLGASLVLGVSALLSCGSSQGPTSPAEASSEILYVLNNGSAITYSVDPNSLTATPMEQAVTLIPPNASLLQFDPSPRDNFLYVIWSDAQNVQHLSVFQTDSFGVPQVPATQILNADSLSQFNISPGGQFAYMLQVSGSNNEYYAKIRLFDVQSGNGQLKEDKQFQGTYGPAPFYPALLYGFSPNGSKLYDSSLLPTGSVYRQREIDQNNGTLGADTELISLNGNQEVAIGSVIAVQQQNISNPDQGYLDIFPNSPNPKRAIHCPMAMLDFCATSINVQLDPTSNYVFLTDPVTEGVRVGFINLTRNRILDISILAVRCQ